MAKVTMLIGIPGSGKSTLAKTLDGVYVCPDEVRKELYGDISIQGNPKEVFGIVNQRIRDALANGNDVIYDATNTTVYRSKTISEFRNFGANKVIGVYLDTPFDVCWERNLNRNDRSEPVPIDVMSKMYQHLQINPPVLEDGFDRLCVIVK